MNISLMILARISSLRELLSGTLALAVNDVAKSGGVQCTQFEFEFEFRNLQNSIFEIVRRSSLGGEVCNREFQSKSSNEVRFTPMPR